MKIKYVAWKKVINSDVNRLIYNTQGPGLHNKGDQAIQNFNTLYENPGLWTGFTNGTVIPRKKEVERLNIQNHTNNPTTYDIDLFNSVNKLRLWEDENSTRHNPVKINHEIWDRSEDHKLAIIEPWYLGYMRLLHKLLFKMIERDGVNNADLNILYNFVDNRLSLDIEIRANILKWIYDTQDGFAQLFINTNFMKSSNLSGINDFIEKNFYVVVKCDDEGKEKNIALMADSLSDVLHPEIKRLLQSCEKGGEQVDIDVSVASASPDANRFLAALNEYKNIILYGPPGTGKTHMLTELMNSFNASVLFDDLNTEAPFMITGTNGERAIEWCTFHPNYTYENFVTGLNPIVQNGNLGFEATMGPMLKQSLAAKNGIKSLLVIDEINRAKTDDVFGSTIALLDRNIEDEVAFTHPIKIGETTITGVPSSKNLFIVGTMNSLDKNTTPLSPELRKRFITIEISPNPEVLRSHLQKNHLIPEELINFCCKIMRTVNNKIHEFCGKEFELGQGYFWNLVTSETDFENVMAEILLNKVMPHLREVLPSETLEDFFTIHNKDILYVANEFGYEFADLSKLSNLNILEAFSKMCDCTYQSQLLNTSSSYLSFDEYETNKINSIKTKILRYKNVILKGCSGVGKSYIIDKLSSDPDFPNTKKIFWHSSTDYSDNIEGIHSSLQGTSIKYENLPGMIIQLAKEETDSNKLMIIEGINKSNPAENFGELITLLEPDKRSLSINGTNGTISIPEKMFFICTMNPTSENQTKLDSAMKRRFIIIDLYPDYELVRLHLNVEHCELDMTNDSADFSILDSNQIKFVSIELLKQLNKKISYCIGTDYQFGHSVIWDLPENCSISDLINTFDYRLLPQLEELCYDESIAHKIFGNDSPAILDHNYGIELLPLNKLSANELNKALIGLLSNE